MTRVAIGVALIVAASPAASYSLPRRAVLRAAAGASLAASPLPSFAFFESPEQVALTDLATVQPKVRAPRIRPLRAREKLIARCACA